MAGRHVLNVIAACAAVPSSRSLNHLEVRYGMRPSVNRIPREARRSRHIHARLVKHGSADRLCVVSDVFLNGAKIVVQGEAAIPTHFELAFDLAGTQRLCELIWWQGKTAGVKFVR